MKTKEILDKYKKILSPIIGCKPEELDFYITERGTTPDEKAYLEQGLIRVKIK